MSNVPTRDELLAWLAENPSAGGKREITRAFGLKGSDRVALKELLNDLKADGLIERHRRNVRPAGLLPPVSVIRVTGTDADGDLFGVPDNWDAGDEPPPRILINPGKISGAPAAGDRLLAKLRPVSGTDHAYEAKPMKRIASASAHLLGIFRETPQGGRILPVDKRSQKEWLIARDLASGARDGELVEAEAIDGPRLGLPRGRVIARHGEPGAPRQVSLIAMVQNGIAYAFEDGPLDEANAAKPITDLGDREDLRDLPLITIDPADARDHDDAVCAAPDEDPANPGGHVVWVAIADVAHYVTSGSELDAEARRRGNSTYFPDRVSPMLPEELSADLCSLHEGVDRPCMAVRMVLNADGQKISHRFTRGLMRSHASLSYEVAQAAIDGEGDLPEHMLTGVLRPLFNAYRTAIQERDRRQPLDLDLPERKIILTEEGEVQTIGYRDRMDAHRVIEDFMILANVAAAETLESKRTPCVYRVHEEPKAEKLDALRETVETLGLTLAKGQVLQTRHFNQLLAAAKGTDEAEAVSMSVLRTQTQAYYGPENLGHFGLGLRRYAHFTSPIRRYADLLIHRALITALKLGEDGLGPEDRERLSDTAQHISETERRSMAAERDTVDRYVAAYLSDREGAEFEGRVAGVSRAGAFVRLDETGADGLIPISTLGTDYFNLERETNRLIGERTGRVIGLGMRATVRLIEAVPITGGLIFELLSIDGAGVKTGRRGEAGKPSNRRKMSRGRIKKLKSARKAKR
ncbi:MAG: ribonuclease R [Paracoccaceae bacterium]